MSGRVAPPMRRPMVVSVCVKIICWFLGTNCTYQKRQWLGLKTNPLTIRSFSFVRQGPRLARVTRKRKNDHSLTLFPLVCCMLPYGAITRTPMPERLLPALGRMPYRCPQSISLHLCTLSATTSIARNALMSMYSRAQRPKNRRSWVGLAL